MNGNIDGNTNSTKGILRKCIEKQKQKEREIAAEERRILSQTQNGFPEIYQDAENERELHNFHKTARPCLWLKKEIRIKWKNFMKECDRILEI